MTETVVVTIILMVIVYMFGILSALFMVRGDETQSAVRLNEAWKVYHSEADKYNEIDSVVVNYSDGRTEKVSNVKYTNLGEDSDLLILYDKYEKAIKFINKKDITDVNVFRNKERTEGTGWGEGE